MLLGAYGGAAAQTEIPQSIQPPPESRVKLQALAKGEQIYQCTFSAGQFQWQLKAPDALLLDTQGKEIGRHYAGPVWEHRDGSLITGKILRKLDAPPGKAIPWLLLETVQHKGSGTFAEIRYINRVETQGGLPPAKRCDGNRLGGEKRVPYRAVYFFYTTRNSDGNG